MKNFRVGLVLLAATFPAIAQTWDNTGNHLLNGTYYYREVTLTSSDAVSIYGTITFTNGNYSINAAGLQASQGTGAGPIASLRVVLASSTIQIHSLGVLYMDWWARMACLSGVSLRPVSTTSS